MFCLFARLFAIVTALLWAPVICFVPTNSLRRPSPFLTTRTRGLPRAPAAFLQAEQSNHGHVDQKTILKKKDRRWEHWKIAKKNHRHFIIGAALLLVGTVGLPSPCFASGILSHVPSPNDLKVALASILDGLSQSGIKGMVVYTLLFTLWTMTVGGTTPIETAAGMAFPLKKAIPLSAIGKIGGAFFQYALAKYLFSDYARKKMANNKWLDKINASFQSHPYRVALIWRFSPLPEFVKNIGPALVPTLRTRYQILATLTHGLPFTILWSCLGREAAIVARGGEASLLLKRMVPVISAVGLVVSPTLFGMWLKGLSRESTEESNEA
mmetsp:Transcript_2992/g.6509  ORF Transcript_2992/g.6509 Transcript_2992/m.6509 type:complete len:325 (+) Transcript_2992:87-1061(+)